MLSKCRFDLEEEEPEQLSKITWEETLAGYLDGPCTVRQATEDAGGGVTFARSFMLRKTNGGLLMTFESLVSFCWRHN